MASLSLLCLSPFIGSKTSFLLSLFYNLCLGKEIRYNRREKWKDARRRAPKGKKRRTCIILYTRFLVVIALMLKLNMLRYVCASIETRFFFSFFQIFVCNVCLKSKLKFWYLKIALFIGIGIISHGSFGRLHIVSLLRVDFCITELLHIGSYFFKISDLFQLNEC